MRLSNRVLLVAAMVIAPFTLLRFGMIGVAEILVLIVFLVQASRGLRKSQFPKFVLTKFWLAFLGLSMIGLGVNAVLLDERTSTWPQIVFDLGAYVFILATCYSLERLVTHTEFDVKRFVSEFVFWSGSAFVVLYIASQFTASLFGLPLRYYEYFVPWAENLHQVSMTLVPLPFLAVAAASTSRSRWRRLVFIVLVPATMAMAVSTGSSKAMLSMYVGAFAMAYSFALLGLGRRWLVQVNLLFGAIAVLVVSLSDVSKIGEVLFEENDVGGVRNMLYMRGMETGLQSPFVGHGPGPHVLALGAYMDAHQTWLTAFLQAGLPGALLFTGLVVYIGKKLIYQPALLAAFSTLIVYAAGGDILRRLPAWIVIFSVAYYSDTASRRAVRISERTAVAPGVRAMP